MDKKLRTPEEKRKRIFWLIVLLVAAELIVSTCVTAWQVRKALLCTDTCYLPANWITSTNLPAHQKIGYEIVWYEEDECSIPILFNKAENLRSPDDTITAKVIPLATLYGIGDKWTFLIYSVEVHDAQGNLGYGAWKTPAMLWFKWKPFHWEAYTLWVPL